LEIYYQNSAAARWVEFIGIAATFRLLARRLPTEPRRPGMYFLPRK